MLGIDINLAVGEEWIKTVLLAEIIKQEAAPAVTTRTALWCTLADQWLQCHVSTVRFYAAIWFIKCRTTDDYNDCRANCMSLFIGKSTDMDLSNLRQI